MGKVRAAFAQRSAMTHPCSRSHYDAGATVVQTPTQFGVLAVEVDRRIEPPERSEEIGAHQEVRRREGEDVADAVVLFLVDLTGFDHRIDLTESIHAEPHRLQDTGLVPVDELGSDGTSVRSVELFDEQTECIGFGGDVVVTDQEHPVVALDQVQHFVRRRSEADVVVEGTHERRRQYLLDPCADLVGLGTVRSSHR